MGFFLARGGQFDDFLLNESDLTQRLEDSVFSGQPIGAGDGVTKNFQLVRNFGGFLEACQTGEPDGNHLRQRHGATYEYLHHQQWVGAVYKCAGSRACHHCRLYFPASRPL